MHKATLKRMERETAIRELAGTMPAWKIAEHFNVSENNLQGICSKAGISLAFYHKHWSDEDRRTIINARANGMLVRQIAELVGRSEGAVSALLSHIKLREQIK